MKTVEKITKELNLRNPQELSLIKLEALVKDIKIGKENVEKLEARMLGNIKFDTNFPSFSFALATGVGKTR